MEEKRLIENLVSYFRKKHYNVDLESKRMRISADLILQRNNRLTAIEAKGEIGDLTKGIGQAISYFIWSDESYLALPKERFKEIRLFLNYLPIGIILVDKNKVTILKKSKIFKTKKELKTKVIDYLGHEEDEEMSKELLRLKNSLTKETLWIWILRLLMDGPSHAYTVKNKIEKEFGFSPGRITCYKVLYLLQKRYYVKTNSVGRKIFYRITPLGKRELMKGMRQLEKIQTKIEKGNLNKMI
jgi:DNA-binding PadR family transcriptional regulator